MAFLLTDALHRFADQTPDQEALVCRKDRLTYGELESRTNQLCRTLIDQGVKRGDRVGIYLDKSVESVIALYGIMKAGAAYVPLDPAAPIARTSYVIKHCDIKHVVTAANKRRNLVSLFAEPDLPLQCLLGVPAIEGLRTRIVPWEAIQTAETAPVHGRALDIDLAYIMYTSGSTGDPKGIMHTHASGLSYARWAHEVYQLQSSDRLTNHAPLHFDLSTFDFFAGALAGATTVVVTDEYLKLPASYSQLLQDQKITTFFTVPYALTQLLMRGSLDQRDLSALRWVIFGGEPFPTKHLAALMECLPQTRFSNMYGPAEVNGCTYYHVPRPLADTVTPLPIGTVWRNADFLIAGEDDQIINGDEPGELLIRSSTMMQGYWRRPDLDELAFAQCAGTDDHPHYYYCTGDVVQRLRDGNLRFLGRKDRQIKTRGHRVELDEVEAAILGLPPVEEAAVFTVPDGEGSQAIHAAVILAPTTNGGTKREAILAALQEQLPHYAVPSRLTIEMTFPRTTSDKIDRRALQTRAAQP